MNSTNRHLFLAASTVLITVLVILPRSSLADIPQMINYQGYLTDSLGTPVDQPLSMTFRIWDHPTDQERIRILWTEERTVSIENGFYSINLGEVVSINLPFDKPYYLGVQAADDDEMQPRQPLTSVGYAFKAKDAESLNGLDSTDFYTATVVDSNFVNQTGDAMEGNTSLPVLSVQNTGSGKAIFGQVSGSTGIGIHGTSSGSSGTGVYGTGYRGVWGSGSAFGVLAFASGTYGEGVYGYASNSGETTNIGVHGKADGISGRGVYGEAEGFSGVGVYGHASNDGDSALNYGGYFTAAGRVGRGVYGAATGESGTGVYGESSGIYCEGVHGQASGFSGRGLSGVATNTDSSIGVLGNGKWGVYGETNSPGVAVLGTTWHADSYAGSFTANVTNGIGIKAEGGPSGYAAEFIGNIMIKSRETEEIIIELGEGLDYAEGFDLSDGNEIVPGTVLVIDAKNPGKLAVSTEPYDRKVAGIVAGANGQGSGVRLGAGLFDHDVALAGRVYCHVDGTYGKISPGDLLTTSPTPGYAMVVKDYTKAQGAVLGKAMESLSQGRIGNILVLVTLQ